MAGATAVSLGKVTFCDTSIPAVPACSGIAVVRTARLTPAGTAIVHIIPGPGAHLVVATYPGDLTFTTSTSPAISLTASAAATTLGLAATPASSTYGEQVMLTATLAPSTIGALTADGEAVDFFADGALLGIGHLASGVATLNTTALSTLTIQTSSTSSRNKKLITFDTDYAVFVLLLFPFIGICRQRKMLPSLPGTTLLVLISLGALIGMMGCGSGEGYFGARPQTLTFTVTGTAGSLSHNASQTATLNLQ